MLDHNQKKIIVLIQGPAPEPETISYYRKYNYPIVYSCWDFNPKDCGPNEFIVKPELPIQNSFFKKISEDGPAVRNNILQVKTTFCGLKYIKDNFDNNCFVLKVRSDEFANFNVFENKIESDEDFICINWIKNDSISDHMFIAKFNILFSCFDELNKILDEKLLNENPKRFHPNCSIEETIWRTIIKYFPDTKIKSIELDDLIPYQVRRNQNDPELRIKLI